MCRRTVVLRFHPVRGHCAHFCRLPPISGWPPLAETAWRPLIDSSFSSSGARGQGHAAGADLYHRASFEFIPFSVTSDHENVRLAQPHETPKGWSAQILSRRPNQPLGRQPADSPIHRPRRARGKRGSGRGVVDRRRFLVSNLRQSRPHQSGIALSKL